jgi:hypothetical protein
MADIAVTLREQPDGWTADVVLRDGERESLHAVSLSRRDYDRLSGVRLSPEDLIRASFEFLLEREPPESILPRFDLPLIARYFPDYERAMARRR